MGVSLGGFDCETAGFAVEHKGKIIVGNSVFIASLGKGIGREKR